MAAAKTYHSTKTRSTTSNTATYNTVSIGTASDDRYVILGLCGEPNASGNEEWSSVTIGGVSATKIVSGFETSTGISAAIYALLVTSGTTCDIVATSTGNHLNNVCHVWTATGINATATATNSNSSDPLNMNTNVPSGGVAFGCGQFASTTAITTTGFTEDYDASFDGDRFVGGSYGPAGSAESPRTFTFDGGTGNAFGVVAVFEESTAVSLTAPKLSSGSVLRAPSATPVIAATAPKIASASTLRAPSAGLGITAPKLASVSQLRAPTVALSFTAPKIASGSVLYAPAVSYALTLTAPTLASTSALRAPSSALAFFAAKLASVSTLYAPTASVESGEVTLVAPKLASTSVLRAPSASLALALGAPHLGSVSVIYAPTNALGVTAPKLGSVSALFAPTVTVSLTLNAPHLASVSALYSPAATVDTGAVTPEPVASGTTGGGGAAQFYRGKRRHEVRKAIRRALAELTAVKSTRSRKRKARRIAQALVAEFGVIEFAPILALARPPLPLAPLADLQRRVFDLTLALREKEQATAAKATEMQELFEAYEREAARLDAQEEEEAIAMILAVAS